MARHSSFKKRTESLATLMQDAVLRSSQKENPKMLDVSTSVKLLKDFERFEQNLIDKMQYESEQYSDSESSITFQSEDKDIFDTQPILEEPTQSPKFIQNSSPMSSTQNLKMTKTSS